MEEKTDLIEDQPPPGLDAAEAQIHLQTSVNDLGEALMRKFKINGNQFNALELEVRLFVAIEQMNVLSEIVKQLTGGSVSDTTLTEMTAQRITIAVKSMLEQLASAPLLVAVPAGAKMNGSKHN